MSFPGRLVDTPSGRVFVHQGGSGAPVVLIHGMYVSAYYFKPVLDELEQRFAVTTVDLPGFGESDRPPPERYRYDADNQADTVARALDALGIDKARIVGHSMGGGVAIAFASRHPDRTERLVLENSWIYPIVMPFLGRLLLKPLVGGFLFKNVLSRRDIAGHFRGIVKDPGSISDEYVDYYWERLNRAGARAAGHAALTAFASMPENTAYPGKVKAPTLIVWGEEDPLFPLAHAERLAKQIVGAQLSVVPACGHSPHEERPDEYLRVVLPFLEGATHDERASA